MNLRHRPARLAAAVGAVLAAGTVTAMALTAGTASADEPGRCTQNVNVREDPEPQAKIVALCEAGKQVKLGDERNGFVHLDELGGWASKDFVKADETAASSDDHDSDADERHSSDDGDDSAGEGGDDHRDGDHANADGDHADAPGRTPTGNRNALGGLLG